MQTTHFSKPRFWNKRAARVIILVIFVLLFLRFVTGAQESRFSFQPDWIYYQRSSLANPSTCSEQPVSHDILVGPGVCTELPILYVGYGFPLKVADNGAEKAGLAWTINLAFAVCIGLGYAFLLWHRPQLATLILGIFALWLFGNYLRHITS